MNRQNVPLFRVTRSPLYFHPGIRPDPEPTGQGVWIPGAPICDGNPVLLAAGEHVKIEAEHNERVLLRGKSGYVWASRLDLVPLPGT